MEKSRVTEIRVRMDCNGCVQKIKKALQGVTGIYDLYIDFPQQKITIIGCADPEKIVKAIKKTRKSAIICSHTEQLDESAQSTDPPTESETPQGGTPTTECTNTASEKIKTETAPPVEAPCSSQPPENPPSEPKSFPESENATSPSTQPSKAKDVEEIHVIHHHPPEYGYRYAYGQNLQQGNGRQWSAYANTTGFVGEPYQTTYASSSGFRGDPSQSYTRVSGYRDDPFQPYASRQGLEGEMPQPYTRGPTYRNIPSHPYPTTNPGFGGEPSQQTYVTHSYNIHKPSPYVTEYAYPLRYSQYSRPDYNQDYYSGNNNSGNGSITSMFSEENPNACRIV